MSRIRQLALNWIAQADADEQSAITQPAPERVKESLLAWARTRRNCAWELIATLQTMPEKENPSEEGPSTLSTDRESV
jgi:hypothetical protein